MFLRLLRHEGSWRRQEEEQMDPVNLTNVFAFSAKGLSWLLDALFFWFFPVSLQAPLFREVWYVGHLLLDVAGLGVSGGVGDGWL